MQFNCVWFLVLAVVINNQAAAGATFVTQANATFEVKEFLDGTTTTVSKLSPITYTLTTDYTQIAWSMSWNVNLSMSGGPTQSFETTFQSQGTLTTDAPSPLSFPDAAGRSSAGLFYLIGNSHWVLTERIVTATDVHDSGAQSVNYGNGLGYTQSIYVNQYPPNLQFDTTLGGNKIPIGRTPATGTNYIAATINIPFGSLIMPEQLLGDFNSSSIVDSRDYVTWRKGGGLLSGFLTDYGVWRSNFGNQLAAAASNLSEVPEPSALFLAIVAMGCFGLSRKRLNEV